MANPDVLEVLDAAWADLHTTPTCRRPQVTAQLLDARSAIAELIAASPDMAALFRTKWGNLDPDANAVYERFAAALAACRGL